MVVRRKVMNTFCTINLDDGVVVATTLSGIKKFSRVSRDGYQHLGARAITRCLRFCTRFVLDSGNENIEISKDEAEQYLNELGGFTMEG